MHANNNTYTDKPCHTHRLTHTHTKGERERERETYIHTHTYIHTYIHTYMYYCIDMYTHTMTPSHLLELCIDCRANVRHPEGAKKGTPRVEETEVVLSG